MTHDELVDMAHEAGITYVTGHGVASATFEWLDRFARLVAAREREACAKLCEQLRDEDGYESWGTECATAIRARREK
jgi:hypothetical protein